MNQKTKNLISITILMLFLIIIAISNSLKGNNKKSNAFDNLIIVPKEYNSEKIYFDYSKEKIEEYKAYKFDENEIIMTKRDEGYVYNIADISFYGLYSYSKYIEDNDKNDYEIAKKHADYLIEIQNKDDGGFYYEFEYKVPGTAEKLEDKWISASGQGIALSLLSRIYSVEKDEKYLNSCLLGLKPFAVDVQDGGLKADLFGHAFYEEYPTKKSNYSLNGLLLSSIGVHDLYEISKNETALEIYKTAIETLKFALPFFDYDNISLYNLGFINDYKNNKCAIEKYHIRNIAQLEIINQFEKDDEIDFYISKWKMYVKN